MELIHGIDIQEVRSKLNIKDAIILTLGEDRIIWTCEGEMEATEATLRR